MHATRLTVALLTILFIHATAFAQYTPNDHTPPPAPPTPVPASHAIYTELGGPGMLLSLNFDTRLTKSKDGLGIRAGIGSNLSGDPSFVSIPVGLNYLAGHGGNYFELGAGATYVNIGSSEPNALYSIGGKDYHNPAHLLFGNLVLGYRRQPTHGGLNVRAGISPYVGKGTVGMLPYLSLGYNF
jgi:hypothetical protein